MLTVSALIVGAKGRRNAPWSMECRGERNLTGAWFSGKTLTMEVSGELGGSA